MVYIAEAELTIKRAPEDLFGRHGIQGIGATGLKYTVWDSRRMVGFAARKLSARGEIIHDLTTEPITSIKQAEIFLRPTKKSISIAKLREFDLVEVLESSVPEGAELLSGDGILWKETRIPTPYVYCLGIGRLIDRVQYDPSKGWQPAEDTTYEEGERRRCAVGLIMKPLLNLSVNVDFTN